jgi:hypothetical protein
MVAAEITASSSRFPKNISLFHHSEDLYSLLKVDCELSGANEILCAFHYVEVRPPLKSFPQGLIPELPNQQQLLGWNQIFNPNMSCLISTKEQKIFFEYKQSPPRWEYVHMQPDSCGLMTTRTFQLPDQARSNIFWRYKVENVFTDKSKEDCKSEEDLLDKLGPRDIVYTKLYEPLSKFTCKNLEFYDGRRSIRIGLEHDLENSGDLKYATPAKPR